MLINYVDYAWHTGEDGEVFVRELARVPEGEVGAPTPAPIGRGLETIGSFAGIAEAGPAPLVMDLAASHEGSGRPGR